MSAGPIAWSRIGLLSSFLLLSAFSGAAMRCATPSAEPDLSEAVDATSADVESTAFPEQVADEHKTESSDILDEIRIDRPARTSLHFKVRGSVEQIDIWKASPATAFEVVDPNGAVVASGTTDDLGSLVLRLLPAGTGLAVRPTADPDDYTAPVDVMSVEGSLPPDDFYESQILRPGYGYIETRDGTTLSVFVTMPGPPEAGPYPTVVNYSGYSPSMPGHPLDGPATAFCDDFPILCDAPDDPSCLIAGIMGYATVGVNIRGTGCSGGSYDYFEPLQSLDGYDAIEVVAHQPWVLHHKVGMVGLSFPGITQLFVASKRPPGLASIAPMSVIADTMSSTLVPGGIFNNGFALEWITHVLDRATPYGDSWVRDVVDAGDTICEDNQWLHSQRVDSVSKAYENQFYTDDVAKPIDPSSFADQIDVPVFLVGQWQDEQTGPHFPILFPRFNGAHEVRLTATNGIHMDGFSTQMLMEWKTFLDLYVAQQVPSLAQNVRTLSGLFMMQVYGAVMPMPPNRFEDYSDFQTALSDYEAEPPVRIIFESGTAAGVEPGAPMGAFEQSFNSWPVPQTVATRFYFQPDGSLAPTLPPSDGGASSFEHDPEAGERISLASGSVDPLQPDWSYRPLVPGRALAFISAPLEQDLVLIGHASVDLWLQSTAADADLEINLTDVRPDGNESLVQSGWLRASHRALRDDATELWPVKTHREEDAAPLPAGQWTSVRIELMPFSHIFRVGSQIRLSIDTPGDSCARWRFLLLEYDSPPIHSVAHQLAFPSSVVFPVVPGVAVETPRPDCHALRGQPCRLYVPLENQPMP